METAFLAFVRQGVDASILLLIILAIRLFFRILSGKFRCFLWALAAYALIVPSTLRIPLRVEFLDSRDALFAREALAAQGTQTFPSSLKELSFHANDFKNTLSEDDLPLLSIFSILWLSCCVALWTYMLFNQVRLYKILRISLKVKDGYRICDQINDAFVFGFFHPCIYIPSGLSTEYLASVLAHERAHIQRRDYLWKLLGYLILSIYCFHPLVWISYFLFCKDIELACDEAVVKNMDTEKRVTYSHSLLYFSTQNRKSFTGLAEFGKNNIKERIQHVMNYKGTSVTAKVLSLTLCFLLTLLSVTNVHASPKEITTTGSESETEAFDGNEIESTIISFGFENLFPGEMEIYPETIELADYSDIAWSINYLQMGLFVEIVLIDENGNELIQKVEGGSADGSFKELSSGNYQLAVRCSEDNLKNKNQRSLSGTVLFSY